MNLAYTLFGPAAIVPSAPLFYSLFKKSLRHAEKSRSRTAAHQPLSGRVA